MAAIKKTKTKRDFDDPLSIYNEMSGFDKKDRTYYDRLTDEQKKKFSTFLILKWGATISSSDALLEQYYLMSVNENVNKNFFDISKHPKLQWLVCTTASPGVGIQKHIWLNAKKANSSDNKNKYRKHLMSKMPETKLADIENLLDLATEEEISQWIQQHGLTQSEKNALEK